MGQQFDEMWNTVIMGVAMLMFVALVILTQFDNEPKVWYPENDGDASGNAPTAIERNTPNVEIDEFEARVRPDIRPQVPYYDYER